MDKEKLIQLARDFERKQIQLLRNKPKGDVNQFLDELEVLRKLKGKIKE